MAKQKYITCTGENVSHERTVHQLEYSALRFHDSYVLWYLNIFRLLFFGLGPFALLVYFNYHIHQVSITLHELKIVCTMDMHMQHPKGQLISKCPYEKSVLSKIPTKKFPRFLS